MNKQKKSEPIHSLVHRAVAAFLAVVMTVALMPCTPAFGAEDNVIEISSYAELKAQAMFTTEAGGSKNFEGMTLKLMADIQVPTPGDGATESEIAYATCIFGSESNPFKGTFDGNGYTISGLWYHEVWNTPKADTGLFAATDGAVIENLTIESADIESDMRGGIVVGYASNTLFNHVTVKNSALNVAAAESRDRSTNRSCMTARSTTAGSVPTIPPA